ncbi:hypothetical protein [Metabacillus bambusae]|nr:hypothetical protein [Metabacillus bambusae]
MKSVGLTLAWSDELPFVTYAFLIIVVILGIYFTLSKEKQREE